MTSGIEHPRAKWVPFAGFFSRTSRGFGESTRGGCLGNPGWLESFPHFLCTSKLDDGKYVVL